MSRRPASSVQHSGQRLNRGSVLIVVLWVSIGLVSVALLFGHSMLMAYRGADNDISARQADQAIEGAERYAISVLSQVSSPGTMPATTDYESEELPVGDATVWFLGRPDSTATIDRVYGLVDEASKLNLNTATAEMLEGLPGMTPDLAAAIVAWKSDKGSALSAGTAQFESVEELALVDGATDYILYGEDANLNGVLDANEDDGSKSEPTDNSDGKLDAGILDYVTAFTQEPTTRSDGTDRIKVGNVTAATLTQLTTEFGQIFANLQPGTYTSLLDFFQKSGMKEDDFDRISGDIIVGDGKGLVNVNTASETVLACIVGVQPASAVIAARATRTQPSTGLAWVAAILGAQGITAGGKSLTGRTYQITADIAAVGRVGRGYRRTQFVLDTSTGTPRVIYRRNMSPFGWALGADVRQIFAKNQTR